VFGMRPYWLCYLVPITLLCVLLAPVRSEAVGHGPITPLEQSGETLVWGENFTDMNVSNMQWTYALPPKEQINNFVIPGAVHLGQISTGGSSEHQINHYNYTGDEPFSRTVEFDMYQVWPGSGSRIFVRHHWSENGVFIHLDGVPTTFVDFQDIKNTPGDHNYVYYDQAVGAGQWAHVVVSFLQDFDSDTVETVVAINAEVKQYTMDSLQLVDLETAWAKRREVWSLEFYGQSATSGIYVANVRGYADFMDRTSLQSILTSQVVNDYLATLPAPNTDRGSKWLLPRNSRYVDELAYDTPLAIISANWVSDLTVQFDAGASHARRVITGLSWDFESDGVWDTVSSNGVEGRVVTHTYPVAGVYSVTLEIEQTCYLDNGNVWEILTDTDAITVMVNGTTGNPNLPTVSMVYPENGATFGAGADIPLQVNAADPDGITRIEFYQGAALLGIDTTNPYQMVWNNVAPSAYALYAKASDGRGAAALSAPTHIIVNRREIYLPVVIKRP